MEDTPLTLSEVVELYREYSTDLKVVRASLAQIYSAKKSNRDRFLLRVGAALLPVLPEFVVRPLRGADRMLRSSAPTLRPSFDDVEAEVTYLLIRRARPQTVVEISPSGGWSSLWILSALKDNGMGRLYSYDLVDDALRNVPAALAAQRWTFVRGDVRQALPCLPRPIDYLFIDSDHSETFADWYLENVFPLLGPDATVSIDDVFRRPGDRPPEFGEGRRILEWLKVKGVDYLSFSPYTSATNYEAALQAKSELGMIKQIHLSVDNPCVLFRYRGAYTGPRQSEDLTRTSAMERNR